MDLGRWGDGEMSGGWGMGGEMDEWDKERKKEKEKEKECISAQSKFERGVYEVAGDELEKILLVAYLMIIRNEKMKTRQACN